MIKVAVVGAGAWGVNHVRAFSRVRGAELALVVDPSDDARARAQKVAPEAKTSARFEDALAAGIDAVILATPAVSHAQQARAALEAGKHVLVEKPLALTGADAESVVNAATAAKKTLMVGHLMLFHPAVERLKKMVDAGELGKIHYVYAQRTNLGTVRRDENAMWSLAPHDLSMLLHLLGGEMPESVSARGGSYLQPGIEDVVFVNMRFPSGVLAQVHLSWLDPRKERRLTVVGSAKMVELDDGHPVEKLRIYDKGVDRPPTFTEYAQFLQIRNGDIVIPRISMAEPLELEARHFIECITDGRTPRTDGGSALKIVRLLEAAEKSLKRDGTPFLL